MTDEEEEAPEAAAAAAPPPPTWPERVLRWLSRRPAATLGLFFLLLWTPGLLSLPPLDRDESRFAQSSRQMLESGNFVDIRFGHVPRYKKPVGIYWLQAATTEVAGLGDSSHIWTYRLPSLLGGLLAVLLTFWCARAFASAEEAWIGAALLGSTLLASSEATIATTDSVQLACALGAMGVLLRVYLAGRDTKRPPTSNRLILLGWGAFAAGILVKGPVVPAVCIVTVAVLAAWDRDWVWLKALKPLWGVALTAAIVAPWAVAIWLASHGQFYQQSLGNDFAAKLAGGQETHGAWPGYYLALATISFWPAVLFLAPGIAGAVERFRDPATRFLLIWAGACWAMFEVVPTKLPHYVLPVYPALAILAGTWVLAPREGNASRWQAGLRYLALGQYGLALIAISIAPVLLLRQYGPGSSWWIIAAAAVGALVGIGALIAQLFRSQVVATGLTLLAVLVLYPTLAAGAGPRLSNLWVSPRAAVLVAKDSRPGDPPPALAGYTEPSLVFLLGKDTRLTNGPGAAEAGAGQGGLALVEDREQSSFLAHLAELEADATKVDELSGYNYSRGRSVHITIYRVTATHDITEPPAE